MESRAGVDPVRAVGDDVIGVPRRRHRCDLDPGHRLLGPIDRRVPPLHRRRRTLHRVDRGVLVADHDAVRDAGRGRLEPHLDFAGIGGEEREVHASVAGPFGRVTHLLGPILVVANGKQGPVIP